MRCSGRWGSCNGRYRVLRLVGRGRLVLLTQAKGTPSYPCLPAGPGTETPRPGRCGNAGLTMCKLLQSKQIWLLERPVST